MQNRRNACHKLQKEKVDQQENYKTCVNPLALLVTLLKYTVWIESRINARGERSWALFTMSWKKQTHHLNLPH